MMHRMAAAAALAFALAACGDQTEDNAGTGDAEGEVLGGTISDEMLPLGTIRSQSPPLRTDPDGEGGDNGAGDSETASDGSDDDAPQDREPATQTAGEPNEPEPPASNEDGTSDGQE